MRLTANKRGDINDRVIAEVCYTFLCSMSGKEKSNLPAHLSKQISTESRAKKFSYKSSTDQKRELFSYLDIGFFWTFVDHRRCTSTEYHSALKEVKKNYPVGAIRDMSKHGVSITSDAEYSFMLEQMSMASVSDSYVRNMELVRVAEGVKNWHSKYRPATEASELAGSAKVVSIFIGAVLSSVDYIKEHTGVNENEYKILNYLYPKFNEYTEVKQLTNRFAGEISQKKLLTAITRLTKERLLQKSVNYDVKEYTITKLGIRTVNQFRDRVLKSFNF